MNKTQKQNFLDGLSQSSKFGPVQLAFIAVALEASLHPLPKAPKIRNSKAPALKSLFEWEAALNAQLHPSMIAGWIRDNSFCPVLIKQMIDEFRIEMISKNKQYADFCAAFQTYLNKGYLSKSRNQVMLINSPHRPETVVSRRGGNL